MNSLRNTSRFLRLFFLSCVCVGLWACKPSRSTLSPSEQPQYLRMVDTLGLRMAEVCDPFNRSTVLARYYLVTDSAATTPSDGVRLQVPLRRIATTSATHIGFLQALGRTDRVVALATPHLVYNLPAQPVTDIGEDINLRIEPLLLSHPDALFISAYGQNMQSLGHVTEAGIPVVYFTEWRESSPLARMAWIRFMGALLGEEQRADSLVAAVSEAYHKEAEAAARTTDRRSIMSGASFRGTWYVPSGNTYMGQLFRDAGADYVYADNTSDSSIPLTMEQALQVFSHADVWVGCNASSLSELRQLDEKQSWLRPFQTGRVYNFYHRQNATGGNDFWETGVVHPEYILRDLRWALYPEALPNHLPYFIEKLPATPAPTAVDTPSLSLTTAVDTPSLAPTSALADPKDPTTTAECAEKHTAKMEIPILENGRPEQLIEHIGYTVSYNPRWYIPNWVAYELTATEVEGTEERGKHFRPDPEVKGYAVVTSDYSNSGYDRGHLAPAADMKWSAQAMEESFYMTNICPQNHNLNAGDWKRLEEFVRSMAQEYEHIYICTGPIVTDSTKTIGTTHPIVVPTAFYKVILREKANRWTGIGFVMQNCPRDGKWALSHYAQSIQQVEDQTGIDFFVNIPDSIEEQIESSYTLSDWGL